MASATANAQPVEILGHARIGGPFGSFGGTLSNGDSFGSAITGIGDVDGDGIEDAAVGAWRDDEGGNQRGAVWILFLNSDGSVKAEQKISDGQGGLTGGLTDDGRFGSAVAGLGDLDTDGVPDVAVGAQFENAGGSQYGAVYILFLNANGTVKAQQKIADGLGGFGGTLGVGHHFGSGLAALGDLDQDGVGDLAVGAKLDDDGGAAGANRGATWILFLNSDGSVKAQQKISSTAGGFGGVLADGDEFGADLAPIGDLDGDGVTDLAVGAAKSDDGGSDRGAVWVLFLNADGTVKGQQRVSSTAGGFGGSLADGDSFGTSLAGLGDRDGDGIEDLAVGAPADSEGGSLRGAIWLVHLDTDGTVKSEQKVNDLNGGFGAHIQDNDQFGYSLGLLGDLDGNGLPEIGVGADFADDSASNSGAAFILFHESTLVPRIASEAKISDTDGGFTGTLADGDQFGTAVPIGDLDDDGVPDLAVGAYLDDDGGSNRGAVWILFLNTDGTVRAHQKISALAGGLGSVLADNDWFGSGIAALDDLDGDGIEDIAVGAAASDDLNPASGAVWILFLNTDGTVKAKQKISNLDGGFGGTLNTADFFGGDLAPAGDIDGDGIVDLASGTSGYNGAGTDRGAVWLLFLDTDGTVKSEALLEGSVEDDHGFGTSVTNLGDVNGDGVGDLAVGAPNGTDAGADSGEVWILFLDTDGSIKWEQKIGPGAGGFDGVLEAGDLFGWRIGVVGTEVDSDPVLFVGAPQDDDAGANHGAFYVLYLNPDGTVKLTRKVSEAEGGFGGVLPDAASFGSSIQRMPDLDGDGVDDLVVGSLADSSNGPSRGSVWLLFASYCGDGQVGADEQCDPGVDAAGDCCASDCTFEAAATACDDGNACTDGQCDGAGTCGFVANNSAPCDDAVFCNGADTCNAGSCSVSAGDPCPGADGDGNCAESCDEGTDACTANDLDGSACDDGAFCNGADTCNAGSCSVSAGDPCPGADGDGNCAESCDETADSCTAADANGSACDDGAFCNGADTCSGGACSVNAGDPCPGADGDGDCAESCDETADSCAAADANGSACDDGAFCNGADTCSGGACSVNAGDPCPGADGDGDCAESCDEANDTCTRNDTDASACDDGDACTTTDGCSAGSCVGGAAPDCDDANGCTDDSCNSSTGCVNANNAAACDDGIFCNGADTCNAGSCSVNAGDPCPGADGDGDCAESCDETADSCTAADANGSACDDGTFCNGADTCNAGSCSVSAGDPCLGADGDGDCAESCDETADACTAADLDGETCDDGVFCNGSDQCELGVCSLHSGDPCLGGGQCANTCDESLDTCNLLDGTPCDDGLFCTETDSCLAGACTGAVNPCGESASCSDTCNENEQVCKGCGQPHSNTTCMTNALRALRTAVALAECEACLCDVDGSGSVAATDAIVLLRWCVGLTAQPDQCPELDQLLTYNVTTTTRSSLPSSTMTSTTSTTSTTGF